MYAEPDSIAKWLGNVEKMVKPARLAHVLRVADLARRIAIVNQIDHSRSYLAGLLHDVARDLPADELMRLAPPETVDDLENPLLLHGRAGRVILENWGLSDEIVLQAVEDHVTGPRNDNSVAIAVYIADICEPGRRVNGDVRALALIDLSAAYKKAMLSKVNYLQSRNIRVHPRTWNCFARLGLEETSRMI